MIAKFAAATVVAAIIAAAFAFVVFINNATSDARLLMSNGSISTIQQFMTSYLQRHRHLPAALNGGYGHRHSWRTAIVQEFFPWPAIDSTQAWNTPDNVSWANQYRYGKFEVIPNHNESPHRSLFFVVTGSETAFPGREPRRLDEIIDGVENTALVIEVKKSNVAWTEPVDIEFRNLKLFFDGSGDIQYGASHFGGPAILFADLQVFRVQKPMTFDILKSLFTINGQEPWSREQLVNDGYLVHQKTNWTY